MKTSTIIWTAVGILLVALAWYWFTRQTAAQEYRSAARQASIVSGEAEIPLLKVATTSGIGPHLVANNGMTLYRSIKDSAGKSTCFGACIRAWPPYILVSHAGPVPVGPGVPGKAATMIRTDGSMQVTYNGIPLYFWKKDMRPGEARGEGLGNVWHTVRP